MDRQLMARGGLAVHEAAGSYIAIDTTETSQSGNGSCVAKVGHVQLSGEASCLCVVNSTMWVGEASGKVSLLEAGTGRIITVLSKSRDVPVTVMRTARGIVWMGYTDGVLRVYNALSMNLIKETKLHNDYITDIAVTSDCDTVYSSSVDCRIRYWSTLFFATEGVRTLGECGGAVRSLKFYHRSLFSGGDDSRIIEWDTENKKRSHVLKAHSASVLTQTVYNGRLWSGSADGTVCVWSLSNVRGVPPECIHMITNPHEGPVTTLRAVGAKVWSVSAGQLYVWNPTSFELEIHCRLSKEKQITFDIAETATQMVCSKTWISSKATGSITILQSDDALPLHMCNEDSPDAIMKAKDNEGLIIQLLESQKALTAEVQTLRAQLAELKSHQGRSLTAGVLNPPMHDAINSPKSLVYAPRSPAFSSGIVHDGATDTTAAKNSDVRKKLNNMPFSAKWIDKLTVIPSIPQYVVVDSHVLLEKLVCFREELRKLIGSTEISQKNNFLYFAEEDDSVPLPIGFITLAELTLEEQKAVERICGGENPPFIVPPPSQLDNASDKRRLRRLINRVRPFNYVPSSASPKIRPMICTFFKNIQPSDEKSNDISSIIGGTDDIGYPPISFSLQAIIRDLATEVKKRTQGEELTSRCELPHTGAKVFKSQSPSCIQPDHPPMWREEDRTRGNDRIATRLPGIDLTLVVDKPTPYIGDAACYVEESCDRKNAGFIARIHALKRDVIKCAAHHPSIRVRACTADLLPSSAIDAASDAEEGLHQLGITSCILVRRLCSLAEKLEVEVRELKLVSCAPVTNDKEGGTGHLESVSHPIPGLVSLVSQMQENCQTAHELVIQHLLDEGRRIALQYGRLMDVLLQRHKPAARPAVSWEQTRPKRDRHFSSASCFSSSSSSSSVLEALDAYDALVEKVRIMERAFFAV
ncbi:hypothetical protein DQ04_00751010 [Trypanosoma grayi]|uniref:hypothetical protein n=1 Tax=Trypanosoma grayi TaxID=71804 RepID=UPI0004F40EA6|nr:hypothetical protein DQ04_00751010 [Trypanosoma grayi]KEG13841.1 hypothetical protein DQ04_00751010 [Trypanosoma grayi]